MDCPAKILLTTLVLVAAPAPALAQGWPATVVAAGPRMVQATTTQPLVRIEDRALRRPAPLLPNQPRLKLADVEIDEVPDVDIRAKDEWLDDEGLRVSPTRVAFKRRF